MDGPVLITVDGHEPVVHPETWLAAGATLAGDVNVGTETSIWFGAVLRAEHAPIRIADRTNIQDGCIGHTDAGFPLTIGSGVSVGHRAVLHGCTIDDDVLVGMAATVMNGARIGSRSLVAAGAVVLENAVVPPRSLVAGVPAKVRRRLTDAEIERIEQNAHSYLRTMRLYRR